MKSEKEFLESMWAAIETVQVERYQEILTMERNSSINRNNIRIGFLTSSLAIITCIIGFFTGTINSIYFVEVFSLVLIIFAFISEMKSYKEVRYNNGNFY